MLAVGSAGREAYFVSWGSGLEAVRDGAGARDGAAAAGAGEGSATLTVTAVAGLGAEGGAGWTNVRCPTAVAFAGWPRGGGGGGGADISEEVGLSLVFP